MQGTTTSYKAFISYSSGDIRSAVRLHARLERYTFPRGARTDDGSPPEQLRPIFRDRLELRAGVSLANAIREALVQSDALVVLCSPRARISAWVNREIREFHAAARSRPTLAFILEGNPLAHPEDPQGCFQNALFETGIATPSDLASDARADFDRRRHFDLHLAASNYCRDPHGRRNDRSH